jgi:transcriptional regulator with XRE-family HTH domain
MGEVTAMANAQIYARWSLEPYCIGMKLRTLRLQKRLTLSRLAAETGLSTAMLSKLETDRMVPTLGTLSNICRIYGVGLGYFFTETKKHALAITRKAHLGISGRNQESVKHTPLHAAGANARLIGEMIEYPAGGTASVSEGGKQVNCLVYVLQGSLQLDAGGMHEVLETCDCAYLETEMAMAWSAAGKSPCRALVVTPGASRGD